VTGKAERFAEFHNRLREYQMRTWAAATLPIEGVAQENAVEIVLLNGWLEDDLKCESKHLVTGKESCSVTVTHRYRVACISKVSLICAVAAAANTPHVGSVHDACGNAGCITVTPV
jgi:hypothetical protein